MHKKTCTPAMAKGSLLARKIKLPNITFPAGKIIGKDEIIILNKAGIKSVEVVSMGLSDILPNATLNHFADAFARKI